MSLESEALWAGGRVLVERYSFGDGWAVSHEPAAGGRFPVTWCRTRSAAMAEGQRRAVRFGARLHVEYPAGLDSRERSALRKVPEKRLRALLAFYDCDLLRGSFTSLIADIRAELRAREAVRS